jgi:hypothetical protein
MAWIIAAIQKLEKKLGIYDENDEIYVNNRNYYVNFKNRIMKPKKKIITTIKTDKGDLIQIPCDRSNVEEPPEYPLEGPVFKITRNAQRSESDFEAARKRRRGSHYDDSDYSSDSEGYNCVPKKMIPTIVYQTTNAIFKDYIRFTDADTQETLKDMGKKYLGRALFSIDRTEFKEQMKVRRREAKRIRKKLKNQEILKKKKLEKLKQQNGSCNGHADGSSSKQNGKDKDNKSGNIRKLKKIGSGLKRKFLKKY